MEIRSGGRTGDPEVRSGGGGLLRSSSGGGLIRATPCVFFHTTGRRRLGEGGSNQARSPPGRGASSNRPRFAQQFTVSKEVLHIPSLLLPESHTVRISKAFLISQRSSSVNFLTTQ